MPIVSSSFRPAWFARGAHAQTFWAPLLRRPVACTDYRERLELPDGDFVDLCWSGPPRAGDEPIVVLLHGLQGSVNSPYARGMMRALERAGLRSVLMHFRGCGGEPNRLPRGYHSGDTADLAFLIDRIRERYPAAPLAAIGYSLGANVLLKWLGETDSANPLTAAAAVSPPFELGACADRISRGLSRIYQWHLLRSLQQMVGMKMRCMKFDPPCSIEALARLRTIREFDDRITAPLHGFKSADDYYMRSSCRQYLARITVPTLIVHACNDPFTPPQVIPTEPELPPCVHMELSNDGGHVGFIAGTRPWSPRYWLEERLPEHLVSIFKRDRKVSFPTVRRAIEADLPALAELYTHSVVTVGPKVYTPEQVRMWASSPCDAEAFRRLILGVTTFVAQSAGRPVGFCGVADDGHIASLYVHGDHVRQGIGSQLLRAALDHARAREMGRLYTEANPFSKPLFEKFGFEVYGTERVDRGGVTFERYLMQQIG